jgi:hypothetical protein
MDEIHDVVDLKVLNLAQILFLVRVTRPGDVVAIVIDGLGFHRDAVIVNELAVFPKSHVSDA